MGLLSGLSGKDSACQCRRLRFDPWVGKIPWRRKWLLIPVSFLGKLDTTEHTCAYLLKYKGHKVEALPSLWVGVFGAQEWGLAWFLLEPRGPRVLKDGIFCLVRPERDLAQSSSYFSSPLLVLCSNSYSRNINLLNQI